MGVSLQVYRGRIGSFISKNTRQPKTKAKPTSISITKSCKFFSIILFLSTWTLLIHTIKQAPHVHIQVPGHSQQAKAVNVTQEFRNSHLDTPCWLTSKDRNFLPKMVNGNRGARGTGIKLTHWNKGPAYLQNKHHEIESIIAEHHPHVLGLSDANLRSDQDQGLVQHADYHLHLSPALSNPELAIARIVVYTHKSLIVKRRADLEDNRISAIWLEVGLPQKKKILVCQGYREWRYLGQENNSSSTLGAQLERWSVFLTRWEQALLEGKEVVVMMDANLDFLKWTNDSLPAGDSTVRLKPLVDLLFQKILPHGVSQMVSVATRSWPGQDDAGLDHVYTNKPEKMSGVYAEFTGGSDHKLIQITRFSKSLQRNIRYVRKRAFKNFVGEDFKKAVQDLSWWDVYSSLDPEQATIILTSKLTAILDQMAPIRTIQVRKRYAPWLSDTTKKMILERNEAQRLAGQTKDQDDYRKYKSLRNQTTAKMRQEKKAWEQQKLCSNKNDPSALWKNVKSWLNWNNSGPPTKLFHNGQMISSPAGLAATMNSYFLGKVAGLRETIPEASSDPLSRLRESMADRQCNFSFQAVKPDDVLKAIKSLKNSKSTGTDYIDTYRVFQ